MLIYKVVSSQTGLKELEREVSILLNQGWEPVGSIAFNQGYSYQAMVGKVENKPRNHQDKNTDQTLKPQKLGALDFWIQGSPALEIPYRFHTTPD